MYNAPEYTESYLRSFNYEQLLGKLVEAYKIISELVLSKKIEKAITYSPSSEIQPTLFPEEEELPKVEIEEEKTVHIKEHDRKTAKKTINELPADTPIYTIDYAKDAPEEKESEGITYVKSGTKTLYQISKTPSIYTIEAKVYPRYKAKYTEEKPFVSFNNEVLDKLSCSPNLLANIAVSKYDDHLPLYRQAEIFEREDINLTRQTMSSWLIKYSHQLGKVERYFQETMFKMNFLNLDETPLEVLGNRNEKGKISKSSFVLLRCGSSYIEETRETRKLVSCSYSLGRSKETLMRDYDIFRSQAYVMTDGLSGYKDFKKHCSCWVHAVRKFKQLLKTNIIKDENIKIVISKYQLLYKIENKYRALFDSGTISKDEFIRKRKEESLPIINEIFDFLREIQFKYSPKGVMGKAISYILDRTDTLPMYLEVCESTPDNNAAERIAKELAVSRKNWLFSNTIDGADATCFMYSLIESAKLNNINVIDYLEYIFRFGPIANTKEELEALLPWNVDFSKLEEIKELKKNARPDLSRTTSYTFGLNGL